MKHEHIELKQGPRKWVVIKKITGECYYDGDRVNCCCWLGSMDATDANRKEQKVLDYQDFTGIYE